MASMNYFLIINVVNLREVLSGKKKIFNKYISPPNSLVAASISSAVPVIPNSLGENSVAKINTTN
jgi:hypothetical protein